MHSQKRFSLQSLWAGLPTISDHYSETDEKIFSIPFTSVGITQHYIFSVIAINLLSFEDGKPEPKEKAVGYA